MSKNNSYNNSYNNSNLNNEPTDNTNSIGYVLVRPFYSWYYDNWYPYFWGSGSGGGYYTNHHHRRHRPFKHRHRRNHRNNKDNLSYGGKKISSIKQKISNIPNKIRKKISGNINTLKRNASALRYKLQSSNNTLRPVKPNHK